MLEESVAVIMQEYLGIYRVFFEGVHRNYKNQKGQNVLHDSAQKWQSRICQ